MHEDRKALADEIERLHAKFVANRATDVGAIAWDCFADRCADGLSLILAALRSDAAAEMRERCASYLSSKARERASYAERVKGRPEEIQVRLIGLLLDKHAAAIRAIPTESEELL